MSQLLSGADDVPDGVSEPPPGGDSEIPARSEIASRLVRESPERLDAAALERVAAGITAARHAAFFDLDRTVLARSSSLAFSRQLYRDGLVGATVLLKAIYAQAAYTLGGADPDRMERTRIALLELTYGWEADRVARIVRETLEEVIVPIVYQEALQLFDEHRTAGRDLWLVSSSGEEIVRPIADHLGVPDVIATRAGIDDEGCFDGTLAFYAYGPHKATAVRQVAEVRGYDLAGCWAYSDSITDLPLLNAVGHAVAVNPDRELRAAAQAMGWETREFRAPVTLRHHLPDQPPTPLLVGLGVAAVAGVAAWWLRERG